MDSLSRQNVDRNSLVQWLELSTFIVKGPGSISARGTKIPQAMWCSQKKKKLRIFHKPDSPPLKCQRSRLSPWISRCRRTLPHEGPPPWSSNHASLGLRPGHLKWHAQSTEHSFSLRPSSYPSSKPLTQWMAPSALILPFLHFTHPHVRCRYRGF